MINFSVNLWVEVLETSDSQLTWDLDQGHLRLLTPSPVPWDGPSA